MTSLPHRALALLFNSTISLSRRVRMMPSSRNPITSADRHIIKTWRHYAVFLLRQRHIVLDLHRTSLSLCPGFLLEGLHCVQILLGSLYFVPIVHCTGPSLPLHLIARLHNYGCAYIWHSHPFHGVFQALPHCNTAHQFVKLLSHYNFIPPGLLLREWKN